jgi:Na+/proline symporter
MVKNNKTSKEYIKHQHKLMILIGLLIVIFTYNAESHIGAIFGALIIGAGLARISDM